MNFEKIKAYFSFRSQPTRPSFKSSLNDIPKELIPQISSYVSISSQGSPLAQVSKYFKHIMNETKPSKTSLKITNNHNIIKILSWYLGRLGEPNRQIENLYFSKYEDELTINEMCFIVEKFPNLKTLVLNHSSNWNYNVNSMLPLKSLVHLKTLKFKGGDLKNVGLEYIARLTPLTTLELTCTFTNDELALLTSLIHLVNLKLTSYNPYITDAGLQHFAKLSHLRTLGLSCIELVGAGLASIDSLVQIKSLELNHCEIKSPHGFMRIARLDQLESLSIKNCNINDAGLALLAPLNKLTSFSLICDPEVSSLYIPITNAGLEHMTRFFVQLKTLKIHLDNLTDDGLAILTRLIELTSLDIKCSRNITDAGLAHLVQLVHLTSLNIGYCKLITNEGLAHLAQIDNLEFLDISYCKLITDDGLAKLVRLGKLKTLKVDKVLENMKITRAGLAKLRAALPPLRIQYV